MSAGLDSIDHTAQMTHAWVNELDGLFLGWHNRPNKIRADEIEDVRHALPADLRALWPASQRAA